MSEQKSLWLIWINRMHMLNASLRGVVGEEMHMVLEAEANYIVSEIESRDTALAAAEQRVGELGAELDHGRTELLSRLIAKHKCRMVSRVRNAGPGREWWIGELLEPLPEPHANETHCFHEKTPGRDTVHFVNVSDVGIYSVLAYVLNGNKTVNPEWIKSVAKIDAAAIREGVE